MKKFILFRILFFMVTVLLWHFIYPHTLSRMEEEAFFIHTPDYYTFYFRLPSESLSIAGNYLAQFYIYPWAAAFLQALIPLSVLLGIDALLYILFKKRTILKTLQWICPLIALIVASISLSCNQAMRQAEKRICIEHWGQEQQWSKILDAIPEDIHTIDELQLRYTLLALSEKKMLGDYFFHLPIKNSEVFFYPAEAEAEEHYRFNSIFFWMLDAPNEALRYAYQHGQRENAGMTFEALRKLADWNAQKGDERQAKFYMNLLEHTSCHDTFIRLRRLFLQQAPQERTRQTFFISTRSIVLEAAIMLELMPENTKPIDYMLCGALADKEIEAFYTMFKTYWPTGKPIPVHYQEALLTLSKKYPEILMEYPISESKKTEYSDLLALANSGQHGMAIISNKYHSTFWWYMLNPENKGKSR